MSSSLQQRITNRFPYGLTAIFALGGTRTSYILQENRTTENPGKIRDLSHYMEYGIRKNKELIKMYFDLGGQNLILELLDIYRFHERGDTYGQAVTEASKRLIDEDLLAFYGENNIDPYFVGIDTLLHLPKDTQPYKLGLAYQEFHKTWDYKKGRRKLIWEVAPIPLYSFHFADDIMGLSAREELNRAIATETNLEQLYYTLYDYYAQASYGTNVPRPDFYLASNRNGDIKPRAVLPFGLMCGGPMRIYTVPYPSFFMTEEGLTVILEDLVNDKRFRSMDTDYSGQLTRHQAEQLNSYFEQLSRNGQNIIGLSHPVMETVVKADSD